VARYEGEHKVRGFSRLDQFLCLAFAQLTYRESLRDIETCLRAMHSRLYHMGIRDRVALSTLADANEDGDRAHGILLLWGSALRMRAQTAHATVRADTETDVTTRAISRSHGTTAAAVCHVRDCWVLDHQYTLLHGDPVKIQGGPARYGSLLHDIAKDRTSEAILMPSKTSQIW